MTTDPQTHLLEVNREECHRLLASTSIGRVAVNVPGWDPVIRPVNFVFDEPSQSVVFCTALGSKMHALTRARRAAFEIDGEEPSRRTAWSVIVVGPVEEVTNASELARLQRSALRPSVTLIEPHWMRIRTIVMSGRRVGLGS